MNRLIVTIFFWMVLVLPASATTIEADQMVAEQQKKYARFDGSVELITDELHLFSDHLIAYYHNQLGGTIDHAEATGHVRIKHQESTGTADAATLDQTHNLLILSGNAELTEQGRLIRGGRIEHHLKGGNTTVSEGKQGKRVHIHIDDDRNITIHE